MIVMLYGLVLLIEYVTWIWPSIMVHQIIGCAFGAFLTTWGIIYMTAITAGRNTWASITSVMCLLYGFFTILSAFWLWWAPPKDNVMVIFIAGILVFGWGLYYPTIGGTVEKSLKDT